MLILLQTFGPALLGLIFISIPKLGNALDRHRSWIFLILQVALILATFGLRRFIGVGIVFLCLAAFAYFAQGQLRGIGSAFVGLALSFSLYLGYWALEKYFVPLFLIPVQADSGDAFIAAASTISIVGISYIGFKLIHFFVDLRAGDIERLEISSFLSWMLFFPSLIAGPMQRYQDWYDQFGVYKPTLGELVWGLRRICLGLFLKVVLADNIHGMTLPAMSSGTLATAPWTAIVAAALVYSLYLYFDFSGYCHIAIGTGVFWGIRLPENFNFPFAARNLAEFWNRWHISLSMILRDYLFYPLSLYVRRSPLLREQRIAATIVPPILTFLIAGIWHGGGFNYLIYGLTHGLGLAYLAVRRQLLAPSAPSSNRLCEKFSYLGAAIANYLYVSLSFVFFSLSTENLALLARRIL